MYVTFRWFGPQDPVTLDQIRQIPAVQGIVTALDHVPVGAVWPAADVRYLREMVARHGLALAVVESLPVHDDIKLGRATRDQYLDHYLQSLANLAHEGITTVCYNFMGLVDWLRTNPPYALADGSTGLAFDDAALSDQDIARWAATPGWSARVPADEWAERLAAYRELGEEDLWAHLRYFVEAVAPRAADWGIKLALHPDDPPWPVLGIPRIVTSEANLARVLALGDWPEHGLALCVGSLGADAANDVVQMARRFAGEGRVHFVHLRNIRRLAPRRFYETGHLSGDLDIPAVMAALDDQGFSGPVRPDHGRQIWGDPRGDGYGLYDRALGAMYLAGIQAGLRRQTRP